MKAFKNSLKILIFIIVGINFISINSTPTKDYQTNINSKVILEGTLTRIAGGGTREIQFPSGYAIKYPVWIVAPSTSTFNSIIFLSSNRYSLNDFMDKMVHVEGEFLNVPDKK